MLNGLQFQKIAYKPVLDKVTSAFSLTMEEAIIFVDNPQLLSIPQKQILHNIRILKNKKITAEELFSAPDILAVNPG